MASTYSDNLRIELIGAGDQAGTWGSTTNTNLGTIIEDSIAGHVAISVTSSNQALTALNGAADQARNAILSLSTTTGAAFAIYAPPASKTYVIQNTSAYAATIYNSTVLGNTTAAGTGAVIPAGKTLTVWSDGTNFAVPEAANLTGTLAVVNGGTGGTTASAARANLGLVIGTDVAPIDSPALTGNPTAPTPLAGDNDATIATTAFVQAAITAARQALYPVGSIYTNAADATNPATLLGFGTWTAFGAGRVPVGFDSTNPLFDTAEETGGSYDATNVAHTHTASTNTTGSHSHGIAVSQNVPFGQGGGYWVPGAGTVQSSTDAGSHSHTVTVDSAGSSGTNKNIQPYITVYMWKRTA